VLFACGRPMTDERSVIVEQEPADHVVSEPGLFIRS
jgi:hypothetical protein